MIIGLIPDTDEARKYNDLINLIPVGKKEAIAMNCLASLLNFSDRELKDYILKARKDACILICSGDEGYYFPANEDELKEYTNRRKRYVTTASVALAPFRRKMKEYESEDQTDDED